MKNQFLERTQTIVACSAILFLIGCGSGGSNENDELPHIDARESITTGYVNDTLAHGFDDAHFEHIGTKVIHKDGLQNNANGDIDIVIIARVPEPFSGSDDLLAFAYDGVFVKSMPAGTVPAFYIDTDDGATGADIGGIKANYLLVEGGNTNTPASVLYAYDGASWQSQSNTNFTYINTSVVIAGTKVVILPDSDGIEGALLGKSNLHGVLALRAFTGGDPDMVSSTTDITSAFTFNTP